MQHGDNYVKETAVFDFEVIQIQHCNYLFLWIALDAVRKEQAGCKYRFYVELYHTDSLS